jgi:hypothetical protein
MMIFIDRKEQWDESKITRIVNILISVAQLVKALCYKPESRGFNSRFFN